MVVNGETIHINHVLIHATINVVGETVHVVGVHFAPGQQRTQREAEARALLAILDTIPAGETTSVMGDFNGYSPVDVAPGSLTPPDYAHGATSPELIGWEPVLYLLNRGFVDSFRTLHPTDFGYTQETTDFLPVTAGPTRRVDFLLRTPNSGWTLAASRIHDDANGDTGSDHYALISDYHKDPASSDGIGADDPRDLPLVAFPNPFTGDCRLQWRLDPAGPLNYSIFDLTGRVARSGATPGGAGQREWSWDGRTETGTSAPAGVYLIRAQSEETTRTAKVWKLAGG